jgi:peroxin-3
VVGAGYVATQYALARFLEARERMGGDRIAKENLRRRFQQNQEDCTFTVLALLPTATDNILDSIPVEQLTHELQQLRTERLARSEATPSEVSTGSLAALEGGGGTHGEEGGAPGLKSLTGSSMIVVPPTSSPKAVSTTDTKKDSPPRPKRSRIQLWNELKINALTRAFTLLYTLSLLTLLTRIQLNLLGRRNYLSSVVSLASPPPPGTNISLENNDDDGLTQPVGQNKEDLYGSDFETNRQYLTFSWWLLHRGWKDLCKKVEGAVEAYFGKLNPRDDVELGRLSELTLEVRRAVEGATEEERRYAYC